ncbi:MAG: ABC transporter permease subunit [Oceanospirillaceae bacterium]|jgi:glycine betaine/proline transport system permease protein|nr:ABC transporter permease subunit [Oceanospirillaceae bacterium]MBT4442532.1 ABC transporter permease subunit [Oceanospirillaceae bacterium]MBT6077657.1 ABC transporter permease subunit [Oceanospirillaceae bacterium]MBT7331322.1 ABC transporter permease subunit [Oceanospirillaceae bacterium]
MANHNTKDQAISQFVATQVPYYQNQFAKIGAQSGFAWTFNLAAGILGPIWFAARGLWQWALTFLLIETFAWVQIVRGMFGDLASDAWVRIGQIEGTLDLRRQQLASAIESQSDKIDVYKRTVASLENAIGGIRLEAQALEQTGLWIVVGGVLLMLLTKYTQSVIANSALEKRFSEWLSDSGLAAGLPLARVTTAILFVFTITFATVVHYSFPNSIAVLSEFPTQPEIRLTAIDWVEQFFSFSVSHGEVFFDFIALCIRLLLDGLELIFVQTPWLVVGAFIALLTWLSAGPTAAIYGIAFLGYMGLLGFWEKAMTTLALLGTAACLSIIIGIPLGMYCARRERFYAFIRPIMDFMQTMPAFVFMIPVIAFFGTGKPAAVVTTMIFGGTPVVRLTVLGLRGVPEHVREAAIAFGGSKWYLLSRVDLPLASPSIRAGINQTIMLSLAMVVVASLIGAKGLGEDVLEALQYANVGQGILAGFAILFCAMILDRIVQGERK